VTLMVPAEAVGLQLYKIDPKTNDMRACEPVFFVGGAAAVDTVLRRAAISGRVEVNPDADLGDYFADIIVDQDGTWDGSVALDRNSYRALKTRWMRCRLEPRA
jgi:hypothetical protein